MGRGGVEGLAPLGVVPREGGVAGGFARIVVRVGACADELRLMGVVRVVYAAARERAGGGCGSVERNASRAAIPSCMERMWTVPWGDGAN